MIIIHVHSKLSLHDFVYHQKSSFQQISVYIYHLHETISPTSSINKFVIVPKGPMKSYKVLDLKFPKYIQIWKSIWSLKEIASKASLNVKMIHYKIASHKIQYS